MGGYYLMDRNYSSVLIGNGIDIQVGGDDYLNKWIIVRLLAKAKMGKYDMLFQDSQDSKPLITGDEIIELFSNMVGTANKVRKNEYKDLAEAYGDKDLIDALKDFEQNHTSEIRSIEEIGMEDWLLIFLLFLIEQEDILDQYESIKQGFERMIFDAIYCEGNIRKLHSKMNKLSKIYFSNFDNIFTLNYDDTIEKLTNRSVFHLHGDFKTKNHSENPQNALGYLRLQKGQNIWFPSQFEHCNCSAILDFSGNRKYNYATSMTKAFLEFEKLKETVKNNEVELTDILEKLPAELHEPVNIGVEKNLHFGHNYHFQDFEQITGTLAIIGLAPQNDSHIFSCINKSNINSVIFYHYFGTKSDDEIETEIKTMSLPINKPYVIKNVKIIWDEIRVSSPNKQNYDLSETQLELLNALCPQKPIAINDILWQLSSIPTFTRRVILEMMTFEISKSKYHATPETEKELYACFIDFGKTLEVAALSPQSLYCIYITGLQSNNRMRHSKNKKRKRKK
jgi:hypothetical protein